MKGEKHKAQSFKSVVPDLFLTVAHFHFENLPSPYSQSIAQELDLNFHQSWIWLKRFLPAQNRWSPKKRSSPKFKRFFWLKTGDLQKKCKYDFFKPKCSVAHCKILLWHGPPVENHWFKASKRSNSKGENYSYYSCVKPGVPKPGEWGNISSTIIWLHPPIICVWALNDLWTFFVFFFGLHLIWGTKTLPISGETLFWSSLDLLKSVLNVCHIWFTWKKLWSRVIPPNLQNRKNWSKVAIYPPPNAQHKLAPLC